MDAGIWGAPRDCGYALTDVVFGVFAGIHAVFYAVSDDVAKAGSWPHSFERGPTSNCAVFHRDDGLSGNVGKPLHGGVMVQLPFRRYYSSG